MIADRTGETTGFALDNLQKRARYSLPEYFGL